MAHVRTLTRATGKPAYEVRWVDGGRHRQRTFTSSRAAERFALRVESDLRAGQSTEPLIGRKTVQECIDESMATARTRLKPRTYASYKLGYARYISPHFGQRRIAQVTSAEVEAWVVSLTTERHLSAATVRNQFVALNKVFRYALRHRYISANPATGTPLPRTPHAEAFRATFLTSTQVEALAADLDEHAAPYGLLVRTAAYTGLRAGELAALRIRDVNLMRGEVSVTRTLARIAGEWTYDAPKSARSTRVVPILNPQLVAELRTYLREHPHLADPDAALWPGRAPGGFTHGKRPHNSTTPRREHAPLDWDRPIDMGGVLVHYVRPALKRTGLPPATRLHDLRHTYASLMFAAGVEPYKVSRWLGHANLATTDGVYAHLYLTDHADDAARFAAFLTAESARTEPTVVPLAPAARNHGVG